MLVVQDKAANPLHALYSFVVQSTVKEQVIMAEKRKLLAEIDKCFKKVSIRSIFIEVFLRCLWHLAFCAALSSR